MIRFVIENILVHILGDIISEFRLTPINLVFKEYWLKKLGQIDPPHSPKNPCGNRLDKAKKSKSDKAEEDADGHPC